MGVDAIWVPNGMFPSVLGSAIGISVDFCVTGSTIVSGFRLYCALADSKDDDAAGDSWLEASGAACTVLIGECEGLLAEFMKNKY